MSDKENNLTFGEKVDNLIKDRDKGTVMVTQANIKLIEMGVKTLRGNQVVSYLSGLDVERYKECANQEFFWYAEYTDHTVLYQFMDGKQFSFKDIDFSKLKSIGWYSNFTVHTDNDRKDVYLKLNWLDGTFEMYNGHAEPETRSLFIEKYPEGFKPKLILKAVKRQSVTYTYPSGSVDTTSLYNRYILGYEQEAETEPQFKNLFCIEPNGFIHVSE